MTSRIQNYKELEKQYLRKAKGRMKGRVTDLLNLYKDGHLYSKVTLQREVNRYLGHFKSEGERDLHYFKTMVKYLDIQPSTEKRRDSRIEQSSQKLATLFEKAEAKTKVRYTVKAILYSLTPRPSQKNGRMEMMYFIR